MPPCPSVCPLQPSGVFHALTGIRSQTDLLMHPKLGASWEGFALAEILQCHQPDDAYFYAVHSGCALDLLMFLRGRRVGGEFERADAPKLTRSMQTVLADLDLDELWVIYPGGTVVATRGRVSFRFL